MQSLTLLRSDVKHIKMNNGFFFFLPTSFLAVEKWYGQRMKLGSQVIWYHKRIAALYDSYALFDTMTDSSAGQGEPRSGGTRPGVALPSSCENTQTAVDGA